MAKSTSCLFLRKLRFLIFALNLTEDLFNKLSSDTKFIKIEVIHLKIQVLQSVNFFLFSMYFTHCFVHYLRHKPGRQDVPFVALGLKVFPEGPVKFDTVAWLPKSCFWQSARSENTVFEERKKSSNSQLGSYLIFILCSIYKLAFFKGF